VALALAASVARADLTASYDGELHTGRSRTVTVVGALIESSAFVSGSIDIALAGPRGGAYRVSGSSRRRHVVLRGGNGMGGHLTWHATSRTGAGLAGVAHVRFRGHTVRGTMVLRPRPVQPPSRLPGTCDSAYFRDVVMTQVLVPICGQCHVPGGIAEAANFRVTANDPLATQRSVALNIDAQDPSASRILQKPLGLIPHGGGQQIVSGSAADQILRNWVDIVASGQCGGSPGGGGTGNPGLDLYTANCASCHGSDAHGLDGKPDIHCSRAISDIVRNGRTGGPRGNMPAFPNLTDADIATLQAYLDGLCPIGTGQDLYAGNCSSCHGADAGGTATAPGVRCATRVADALTRGRATAMPAFPTFTQTDITNVAGYLDTLCTQYGVTGADLYASNCSTCHGRSAGGGQNAFGARGPDIRLYDDAAFYGAVEEGTESMPAFPSLDTIRIARIAAWVRQTCPATTTTLSVTTTTVVGTTTTLPSLGHCGPPPATCGNGVVDPGEECDACINDGRVCSSNCTLPRCGNCVVDPGETCDDGNTMDGDFCPASCVIMPCTLDASSMVTASVALVAPSAVSVGAVTLFVDYPEGHVRNPTTVPSAGVVDSPNDLAYAFRDAVLDTTGVGLPSTVGTLLLQVTFTGCQEASLPIAGDFRCAVTDAADLQGIVIDPATLSCTVTIP